MSRSKKKIPIVGNADNSDKEDKRKANRKLRKNINQILHSSLTEEIPDPILPDLKEVSDNWNFNKDGKQLVKHPKDKDYRK